MNTGELDLDLEELSSAEDFLNYFKIDYQPDVVHVNRLHILQRFHDYLEQVADVTMNESDRRRVYADLLQGAYEDFVKSDALTEKVFRVFQVHDAGEVTVPLSDLLGSLGRAPQV